MIETPISLRTSDVQPAPAGRIDPTDLRRALQYAVLAPSLHNTQPWVFRLRPDGVDLYADRARAPPVADPDGRELTMSCGAALYQLELALRHLGYEPSIALLPASDDPDLLARVRCTPGGRLNEAEQDQFEVIPYRRTTRENFFQRHVPRALLDQLRAAAEAEGAALLYLDDEERRLALADLVYEADRLQASDHRYRAELASWVRWSASRRRDGIPGRSLGLGAVASWFGPLTIRTTDWGPRFSVHDRRLAIDAPALAVLGTRGDDARDWLIAGLALGHVLLRATAAGLTASYFNQVLRIPRMRARVREMVGGELFPQAVLPLGYGPTVRATPRRPVAEVTY